MRYGLIPNRMATIKKTKITRVGEDVEKLEHLCTIGGIVNGVATMVNSMEAPQNIKNRTTMWCCNPTLGYLSKRTENRPQRDICTSMYTAALFTISKMWKQPRRPLSDEWIKKM